MTAIIMMKKFIITFIFIFTLSHSSFYAQAFMIKSTNIDISNNRNKRQLPSPSSYTYTSKSTVLQCICINCSRVTNCAAYHFVENKHSQPHINQNPQFTPQDGSPTIHVNIRTNRENVDGEIGRLWSEHLEQTQRAEALVESKLDSAASDSTVSDSIASDSDSTQVDNQQRLVGEEKYDLSVKTTYEYDVVACEDFVKDDGCWIRNMPEEIRLANPDFVPT
jgi:hypothetical protein